MGMPVQLSSRLVDRARKAAKAADRSLTAQIEHWASIGSSAEDALKHSDVMALKKSGGNLRRVAGSPAKHNEIESVLSRIASSLDRSEVTRMLDARNKPSFEADRAHPGLVVKIDINGTRTIGRIKNRRFYPVRSNPSA